MPFLALQKILESKRLLPVYLLMLFVLTLDFSSRLMPFSDDQMLIAEVDQFDLAYRPELGDERYKNIYRLVTYYDRTSLEVSEKKEEVARESSATGVMTGYTKLGDFNYRLVGIFAAETVFAILEKRGKDVDTSGTIKVALGEKIDQLFVAAISTKSVELRGDMGEEITLKLFEPCLDLVCTNNGRDAVITDRNK
tara:strand:+ start:56 stop:640 length:585 start_codon:yes stop_codon:yes gene_type:complete